MKEQAVRLTLDIPTSLHHKLKQQAAARRCAIKELVLNCIKSVLFQGSRPRARRVHFPLIVSEGPKLNLTNEQLSDCLESVDSPQGRQRVADFLRSQPFPHYQAHPEKPGLFIRIDSNGQRTVGRFVNRKFRPSKAKIRSKPR